jgi:hypothetical protein
MSVYNSMNLKGFVKGKPMFPWYEKGTKTAKWQSVNVEKLSTEEEVGTMALKQGEVYKCPDPKCGCEITVTKGAQPGGGGNQAPRCCCGMEMVKK